MLRRARREMRFPANSGQPRLPKAMTVGLKKLDVPETAEQPRPRRYVRDLIDPSTREAAFALGKRTKAKARRRARRRGGQR